MYVEGRGHGVEPEGVVEAEGGQGGRGWGPRGPAWRKGGGRMGQRKKGGCEGVARTTRSGPAGPHDAGKGMSNGAT